MNKKPPKRPPEFAQSDRTKEPFARRLSAHRQRLLDLMIATRWRRWTEAGAIQCVGPRKYVIRLERIPRP